MYFSDKEKTFIIETLNALLKTGARIGKDHYTVTLTRSGLLGLINRLDKLPVKPSGDSCQCWTPLIYSSLATECARCGHPL